MAAKTHEAELRYLEGVREALGLTDGQIAGAIGIDERALRGWRSGKSAPRSLAAGRVDALREFHQRLLATMEPQAAREWVQRTTHALEGRRPVEFLAAGQIETLTRLLIRLDLGLSA